MLTAHALAGAFLFTFAEIAIVGYIWPNTYLDSPYFFYPAAAFSLVAMLGLAACVHLLAAIVRIFRPAQRWELVAASFLTAILISFSFADAGRNLAAKISAGYIDRFSIQVLSFCIASLGGFLLAWTGVQLLARRMGRREHSAGPFRGFLARIALAAAIAAAMTGLAWPALHRSYVMLTAMLFTGLLLPPFAAALVYRVLRQASHVAIVRTARAAVALALAFTACVVSAHLFRHSVTIVPAIAVATLGVLSVVAAFALRNPHHALVLLPASLLLPLLLAPAFEDSFRPAFGNKVAPGDHVILISVDTLRRDVVSSYNPGTPPTPRIDALLADGVRFTGAWAPSSWTLPSVVSMLSGISPAAHRVNGFETPVPTNLVGLGDYMRQADFVAEAFVENPILGPKRGLARSFDRYTHLSIFRPHATWGQRGIEWLWPRRFNLAGGAIGIAETGWRRIRRHGPAKLFLWLHFYDPHEPFEPSPDFWPAEVPAVLDHPPGFDHTYVSHGPPQGADSAQFAREQFALYKGEVLQVDRALGLLVERLKDLGLYDGALIVFASDHGEEFGEKGRWGHSHTPVETLVRIPLGLKMPGPLAPRLEHRHVELSGLPATILAATDESLRIPSHLTPAWPLLAPFPGGDDPTTPSALFMTSMPRASVHDEAVVFGEAPYKFVTDRVRGRERLYDLRRDPEETASVAFELPLALELGRRLYHAHLADADRLRQSLELDAPADMEFSTETLDLIRNLGYVH